MHQKTKSQIIPKIKRVYEDDSYIYVTYVYFHGMDLKKILQVNSLEETGIAIIMFIICKGLKKLHSENYFHGNLTLENISFSS